MEKNNNTGSNMNRVARSALVLGCAMIFSQICGLLSKAILGSTFGASAEVDAYLAANRLTETIFNLMAGGALASAFVPTFSAMLDKENEKDKAWMLASRIGNCLFLVLFFLCAIGFIFAEQVVKYILVPGFSLHDPELQILTVKLLLLGLYMVVAFSAGLLLGYDELLAQYRGRRILLTNLFMRTEQDFRPARLIRMEGRNAAAYHAALNRNGIKH